MATPLGPVVVAPSSHDDGATLHPLPLLLTIAAFAAGAPGQAFHLRQPHPYRQTQDQNSVTALDARLAAGELALAHEGPSGRLRALLAALEIPEASQVLVFSKTSLQRHRISPKSPRAIYFAADKYVGWSPGAAALEIATSDARLGMVFYTLPQDPASPPRFTRDDSCLSCHATGHTMDEPGIVLRSVFADETGHAIAAAGECDVVTSTPISERWGGWYVTGLFADAHRGNGIAVREGTAPWHVPPLQAADLSAFAQEFAVADYLVPTSDIGALLALEQQATLHNLLIRAALQARCLLATDREINAMLGEEGVRDGTSEVLDRLAHELTAALLLANEAPLADPNASAAPAFAAAFAAQWPQTAQGESLGILSLRARMFTLPCSPMVYSQAFAALPTELAEVVHKKLRAALRRGRLPNGVVVDAAQRQAIDRILRVTLPGYQ